MNNVSSISLRVAICMIGMIVLFLCFFWLPWQARVLAEVYPEYAHLQYPLLIGIYMTALPFFYALYSALKLLHYIDKDTAFSSLSVKELKTIKLCALLICVLYIIGFFYLSSQQAGNPVTFILGIFIPFVSACIAIFAALLQKLLQKVIDLKSENDLTV
ncbi:DUF2975 domain-containing protein [Metabacillus sp. HB246100]